MKLPRPQHQEIRILIREQIARLATVIDPHYRLLLLTAATTGR